MLKSPIFFPPSSISPLFPRASQKNITTQLKTIQLQKYISFSNRSISRSSLSLSLSLLPSLSLSKHQPLMEVCKSQSILHDIKSRELHGFRGTTFIPQSISLSFSWSIIVILALRFNLFFFGSRFRKKTTITHCQRRTKTTN